MKNYELVKLLGHLSPHDEVYMAVDHYDGVLWPVEAVAHKDTVTVENRYDPGDTMTVRGDQLDPEGAARSHGHSGPVTHGRAIVLSLGN